MNRYLYSGRRARRDHGTALLLAGALLTAGCSAAEEAPPGPGAAISAEVRLSELDALRAALDVDSLDLLGTHGERQSARVLLRGPEVERALAHGITLDRRSDELQLDTYDLGRYRGPDELGALLEELAARHPQLVKLWEFGSSHQGRGLRAVELSAHPGNETRPVVLFDGAHHARELMTAEVTLHIAEALLAGHAADPQIRRWLDTFRIVVVPQVNPDGLDIVFSGDRQWRKNALRLRGRTVGVDLNRNYATDWNACGGSSGRPQDDDYRGPSAASEPETRAMMELIDTLRPVASISYHSVSEVVIIPFGCASSRNSAGRLFRNIGQQIASGIVDDAGRRGSYRVGTPPQVVYQADGGLVDWAWREQGVLAFAIEVNSVDIGQQPDFSRWRDLTVRRQADGWQRLLRRLERTSVRALVHAASGGEVTFTLRANGGSAPDVAARPRRLRSRRGLLYETVAPGNYRLQLLVGGRPARSLDLTVADRTLNLGTITL
jgi:hypothetical protein